MRFYRSLRGKKATSKWLKELDTRKAISVEKDSSFPIAPEAVALLHAYLGEQEADFETAYDALREEHEAVAFCAKLGVTVAKTATKSQDHHQSSKALVGAVTAIAVEVCESREISLNRDPQTRAIWCNERGLHVTARNLDGAVPSLANPLIVWEIKEYWGKTGGGSKMSDAVYECHLVGRELRDFEERADIRVAHIVFLDGKIQWSKRKSDLVRFLDLFHQGIVDYLFVGNQVESDWEPLLRSLLP